MISVRKTAISVLRLSRTIVGEIEKSEFTLWRIFQITFRVLCFLTEITTTSTSTVTATTEKTKLHTSPSASQFVKTEKMRFSPMEMVIIGFSFGFVAGAVIAWLVVITVRVCSKRRKKLEKLMTSSEYNGYIQSGVWPPEWFYKLFVLTVDFDWWSALVPLAMES